VRAAPGDVSLRVFLAQLFAVTGQWERAGKQLKVVKELDPSSIPMVNSYGVAIASERVRSAVFAGKRAPVLVDEPPPWVVKLIQALALDGEGGAEKAAAFRMEALEEAPALPGSMNGRPFEWLADADSRLGPVFEVFLNGSYYWVPIDRVESLEVPAPEDAWDLVWVSVKIRFRNGAESAALMPVRYPGSEVERSECQMARRTEWVSIGTDQYRGLGQRMFTTEAEETGLLELRRVSFDWA
jgi:type VI secretion system protein ImpE